MKFALYGNSSLKGKRKVLMSIKNRVKDKFNVSISEIGNQDIWQTMLIGVAAIGPDSSYIDSLLNQVVGFIDRMGLAHLSNYKIRLIPGGNPEGDWEFL
tara:strand:- start:318 stop:614 length:297 start_codon:yes stop_codon:yes gene_type:complete